jgi:transcriptional regulator with XRE-family HTH domain
MNDIAATLKRLRAASGYTQKQVAAAVGRSESQISEVENGRAQPSYDLLMKLLELYDATFVIVPVADDASRAAWAEAPEIVTALARAGLRLYRSYTKSCGSYADHFRECTEAADAIGALLRQIEIEG